MAFVNISVNVVAEYSGLCEEVAQEFLEQFDRINALLAWHGMPATIEPDYVVDFSLLDEQRQYMSKFPVEYLRRLQSAYATCKGPVTSYSEENVALRNVDVSDTLKPDLRYSHLGCHAGSEGVYIPNAGVTTPLRCSDTHLGLDVMGTALQWCMAGKLLTWSAADGWVPMYHFCSVDEASPPKYDAGDVIGSSYGLLHELVELAPYIGVALEDDGSLSLHEAERLYQVSFLGKGDYHKESCAWLALHEAAELSIIYGTSIVMLPSTV